MSALSDARRFPPAITTDSGVVYHRVSNAAYPPNYVLYQASGSALFRAKWDDKKNRLFFVALHDRSIKLWGLPDGDAFIPAADQQAYSASLSDSSSRSVPRVVASTDARHSKTVPSLPSVLCAPLEANELMSRTRIRDNEALERVERLRMEVAARETLEEVLERKKQLHEHLGRLESMEGEDRQRLWFLEAAEFQRFIRFDARYQQEMYALLALLADESDQRFLIEVTQSKLLSDVLSEYQLALSKVKQVFHWGRHPAETIPATLMKKLHTVVVEEDYNREVLMRSEAAERTYLYGRRSRDLVRDASEEGGGSPCDEWYGRCDRIRKAHAEALPFQVSNTLLQDAIMGLGSIFRDFLLSYSKIYQEYIRALWGRPVFFTRTEFELRSYRYFERYYAPRRPLRETVSNHKPVEFRTPSPRGYQKDVVTLRKTAAVPPPFRVALKVFEDRMVRGLTLTPTVPWR